MSCRRLWACAGFFYQVVYEEQIMESVSLKWRKTMDSGPYMSNLLRRRHIKKHL
jgi:hypothetical protein